MAMQCSYMHERDGVYEPTGETLTIPCDRVLFAIGQNFLGSSGADFIDLSNGRIKVDANRQTSDKKIWAGGDCIADGVDLTVAAVQDGKLAAESIHKSLRG